MSSGHLAVQKTHFRLEGKKGGQFYTPRSVVELLIEMLEPYKGRVLDPCCGSDGMFVQSEKFVVIFLGKIACCYASFEMPDDYLDLAQTLLTGYFETLEKG
jgi:hypothetical protein